MHFILWTKGSHENTNFDTFKCSDENLLNSSCHFPNHESVFLQILSQTLYTLHKRDQSKCNQSFFRLFSAQIEIHQILVIFETKNKFFFRFFTTLCYHGTYYLHTFLAQTLYTFSKSSLSKYKFDEISLEQSKVLNFVLWWVPFVKII